MTNPEAARQAQILVITVPYAAHTATLESIREQAQGKILVDVTVPLVPPKVTRVQMPPAGSAAQEARQILGEGVEVVDAFQNISYEHLLHDHPLECDVLVVGTSKAARSEVIKLVQAAGMIGWDAGPIENAVVVEGMTSVLININKNYEVGSSGIRITGISRIPD
jgi:NADPH-dependent F420 reductase